MQDDRLTPFEGQLEAALGSLKPTAASVDRDALMFAAGRASTRRLRCLWQGASVLLVVLLAVSIATRPEPVEPQARDILVAAHTQRSPIVGVITRVSEPMDETKLETCAQYVRLRQAVLEGSVEALPASVSLPSGKRKPPLNPGDLDDFLSST